MFTVVGFASACEVFPKVEVDGDNNALQAVIKDLKQRFDDGDFTFTGGPHARGWLPEQLCIDVFDQEGNLQPHLCQNHKANRTPPVLPAPVSQHRWLDWFTSVVERRVEVWRHLSQMFRR
jgi:hypothetical protein